jgi:hypothetical protein
MSCRKVYPNWCVRTAPWWWSGPPIIDRGRSVPEGWRGGCLRAERRDGTMARARLAWFRNRAGGTLENAKRHLTDRLPSASWNSGLRHARPSFERSRIGAGGARSVGVAIIKLIPSGDPNRCHRPRGQSQRSPLAARRIAGSYAVIMRIVWRHDEPRPAVGANKAGGAKRATCLRPVYSWFTEGFDTPI